MSPTPGESIAADFAEANDEVVAFALALRPDQWAAPVPGEGWPVGVLVHHVAVGHALLTRWLRCVARGEPVSDTGADVDDANARHALEHAAVGVDDTVALLRANGAATATILRGLDDDALGATAAFGPADGRTVSAEQLAAQAARHARTHLASARAALGMAVGS